MNDENIKAIVVATRGRLFEVLDQDGKRINCEVRKKVKTNSDSTTPVAVGDNVIISYSSAENAIIESVEERKSAFFRPTVGLSNIKQVIASNLDQLAIVASINSPKLKTGLIDRFLIAAQLGDLEPIIVFNKMDLEKPKDFDQIVADYKSLDYKMVMTSATAGEGIDSLKELLAGHRTIFVGHSGVGKSALLNALHPEFHQKTGEVSGFTNKGKHTTTAVEMFELKSGGFLVDSPGLKVMGLWEVEKEMLPEYYPEFNKYIGLCKFSPCSHDHEPKCAVKQAVEFGDIPESRYQNYIAIRNSL